MHHALVNAGASVGRYCMISTKVLFEHDAVIEDQSHFYCGRRERRGQGSALFVHRQQCGFSGTHCGW